MNERSPIIIHLDSFYTSSSNLSLDWQFLEGSSSTRCRMAYEASSLTMISSPSNATEFVNGPSRFSDLPTNTFKFAISKNVLHRTSRQTYLVVYDSEPENDLHLSHFVPKPRFTSTSRLPATVPQRFSPLWEVSNLEEFKCAFLQVVESHHRNYVRGRVLHRDVSECNIMFYRVHDKVNGVLLDFDNASVDHNCDRIVTSGAQQRIGTSPFMARELLSTEHSPHLYRYDLESFLYFLIWAAMHFDLPQKRRLPINPILREWNSTRFESARDHKLVFLITKEGAAQIWSECRPEFKPLVETWIMPLRSLFRRVVIRLADDDITVEDMQTLDGLITFETFMKALGVQPRKD